ncbi:MAG: hypothetical protein R3217_07700 [Gammaproteobacteria bacterium]|nr:hypothetical protein [Gammaproteobacteria bacterium]
MTQQINLYQPILRRQRKVFSSGTIATLVLGFVVLMGLIWGVDYWQTAKDRESLADLRQQEQETAQRIVSLTRTLGDRKEEPALAASLAAARQEIALKRELLDRIQGTDFSENEGFSSILEGFGRQRISGLWLTAIAVADGGRDMEIAGVSRDAALVPKLVRKLGEEDGFRDRGFRRLQMSRSEDIRGAVDFHIASNWPEDEN